MKALLCPLSSAGYLYPATAAALELHRRGHDVTMFAEGPAARAATAAGIAVLPASTEDEPHAFDVSRWFRSGESQYRRVLAAARELRPDVLVTSVLCPGALLVGETLDLPVVVLGLACHLWPHETSDPAAAADDIEDRRWRLDQTLKHHQELRQRLDLPQHAPGDAARHLLGRALLLRGHPDLEPPGAVLPDAVRQVGPLWWEPPPDPAEQAEEDAFAERLDRVGKPLVYVHLGRTFGGESLWRWIDGAFTGTGYQAVVEFARTESRRAAFGADVVTVRRPRMADLLQRAEAVVTNGTSAPVLGALLHARPLLLRPNGGEQRLLAAACLRARVGVELTLPPPIGSGDKQPADPADLLNRAVGDAALSVRVRTVGTALAQVKSAALAAQEIEDACR